MNKIWLLLISLLVFISCNENTVGDPLDTTGGEVEVAMTIVTAGAYARAYIAAEDALNDITILVVGSDGKFQYKKDAWAITANTFKSNLKIASGLTLYIASNAKTFLNSSTIAPLLVDGTDWSTIEPQLILTNNPNTIAYTNGLPMWSRLTGVNIENKPANDLGEVKLLRSIASTDITVTNTDFVLEEVYICFGADRGLLPYDPAAIAVVSGNPQASAPRTVTGMLTDKEWSTTSISSYASSYYVNNHFYMYENATSLTGIHTATSSPTKVVAKGRYKSGNSTYYPLAFRNPGATPETKLQVTRNCKYILIVTRVNGDGYGTLDEAKEAEDVNAKYEVIDWNINGDNDIFVDGTRYVSVSGKTATLYRPSGSTCFIAVSSNYDEADILMKYLTADTGVNPLLDTHSRFTVELTTIDGQPGFLFTAKQAYGDGLPNDHETSMIVTAGRIEFNIAIRQLNEDPLGWNDGGNTGIDL